MNELFVEKLRNGMSAEDLYKELMSDLSKAVQKVADEKKAAAASKNRDEKLLKARAFLISAIDFYGQWMGEKPLEEKDVKQLEESIKELEELIKQTVELVQKCGGRGIESFLSSVDAEKKDANDFALLKMLQDQGLV